MAETGNWYCLEEGLRVIKGLLVEFERIPVRFGSLGDRYRELAAELKEARRPIERAKNMGAQFHLCVVL